MAYRLMGRLHSWALTARRDDGQGTVEYVGLLLMVGALVAAIIGGMKGHDFGIAKAIATKLKDAVTHVADEKPAG
jgi:hypothetical protein